jgi:hypothetical protein
MQTNREQTQSGRGVFEPAVQGYLIGNAVKEAKVVRCPWTSS